MAELTTATTDSTPADAGRASSKMFDLSLKIAAAGPRGVPLVNNFRFLGGSARYALRARAAFHGQPIVPVTAGNASIVLALGREAAREVFTDNATFHRIGEETFNVPTGRPYSHMFDAVITVNGAEHRRRRKLLMPISQRSAMERYQEIFVETFRSSKFAADGDEPFDLVAELLHISKVNLLRCLLGIEPTDPDSLRLADDVLRVTDQISNPLVMMAPWERSWTPYGRWVGDVASAYRQLVVLIEQRRAEPSGSDALSIICNATDEAGDYLTTSEIVGELHGFFAAGFETTAMTMTWALLTLIGDPNGADRPDLDYADPAVVDAVLKESQRLLPAVPTSLPRRTTVDVSVAGSPTVPRGALLFASAIVEHHDPSTYPEPGAFRPQRWLEGLNPDPYTFFPFGVGARRCLGAAFADAQARAVIGLIAEQERLPVLLTERVDYRMKSGVTAAPRKPIMVRAGAAGRARGRVTGSVTDIWTE